MKTKIFIFGIVFLALISFAQAQVRDNYEYTLVFNDQFTSMPGDWSVGSGSWVSNGTYLDSTGAARNDIYQNLSLSNVQNWSIQTKGYSDNGCYIGVGTKFASTTHVNNAEGYDLTFRSDNLNIAVATDTDGGDGWSNIINENVDYGCANSDCVKELIKWGDTFTLYTEGVEVANVTDSSWNGNFEIVDIYCYGANSFVDYINISSLALPSVPATTFNESTENSFKVSTTNEVSISSAIYSEIIRQTVTITNNTNYNYLTSTINLLGGVGVTKQAECRILFDDTPYNSNRNRSITANAFGSLYIVSSNFTATAGTHNVSLECRKNSGNNNFVVQNAFITGHNLLNEREEQIEAIYDSFSSGALSSTFTKIKAANFTTSALETQTPNITRGIIVDYDTSYTFTTGNTIETYITINGTACPKLKRYGATGTTGSGGGLCLIKDIGNGTVTIPIEFYAKGSGTITTTGHVKEIVLNDDEYNTINLTSTSVSSSSLTKIAEIEINNTNHISGVNIVAKAGVPINSTSGTQINRLQLKLTGDDTQNGLIFNRTLTEAQTGVTIAQDVFTSLSVGTYNVELWASCTGTNCEIVGGELSAYITDAATTSTNEYIITAVNNYTNANINTFNVSFDGALYPSNSTGQVVLSTSNPTANLNIISNNFFNQSYIHDTTGNLEAELYPYTEIFVKASGNGYIDQFNLNYTNTSGTYTTTANASGIALIPIKDITFNLTAYDVTNGTVNFASITETVTGSGALQNHTLTVYLTNSFNLFFRNEITRELITQNVTVEFVSDLEASNYTTDTGNLFQSAFMPAEIEIRYSANGFNKRSYYHYLTNQSYNNITLYMLDANGTYITITATDESGRLASDKTIILKRAYIISGVETYETVEMGKTNFEGEALFTVELIDALYKIQAVENVNDFDILFISTPSEITGTTLNIKLNILGDPYETFRYLSNTATPVTVTDLSFNPTTKKWTATYTVPDSAALNQVCLQVREFSNFGIQYYGEQCTTSSDATLTVDYNGTRTSQAMLYLKLNTEFSNPVVKIASYLGNRDFEDFKALGLTLTLWTVTTVALALSANPVLLIIGGIIGLLASMLMGIFGLSWTAFIPILINLYLITPRFVGLSRLLSLSGLLHCLFLLSYKALAFLV